MVSVIDVGQTSSTLLLSALLCFVHVTSHFCFTNFPHCIVGRQHRSAVAPDVGFLFNLTYSSRTLAGLGVTMNVLSFQRIRCLFLLFMFPPTCTTCFSSCSRTLCELWQSIMGRELTVSRLLMCCQLWGKKISQLRYVKRSCLSKTELASQTVLYHEFLSVRLQALAEVPLFVTGGCFLSHHGAIPHIFPDLS